jgi:competence protein ComGC
MINAHIPRAQRGITLVVSLIMLLVITLLVVSAISWSTINLRVTGNMQTLGEARAAVDMAVNQLISAPLGSSSPAIDVDLNNDGTNDYSVTIASITCVGVKPSAATGAESGPMWDSVWEVQANVTDLRYHSGVAVNLTEGVSVYAGGACP